MDGSFPIAPEPYDAWYRTPLGAAAHRIELAAIDALAQPCAGERALDAGCGSGVHSAWLADKGLVVTGVDRDSEMLEVARRRTSSGSFREGDLTALPFDDGAFDLAIAVTVFTFLDPHQRLLAVGELMRVLCPGGRLVIGDLAPFSLWALQRRIKAWRGSSTWRTARFIGAGELRRVLLGAGGANVRSRHVLYLPPVDWAPLTARADLLERLARPLGPIGAAFVVARADAP